MANDDVRKAFQQRNLTPQQRNVLVYLAHCRNSNTRRCHPKDSTIAEAIGIKETETRQIRRIREALREKGVLRWKKNGRYNSNDYFFCWDTAEETGLSHPVESGATGHPHPKTGETTLDVQQESTGIHLDQLEGKIPAPNKSALTPHPETESVKPWKEDEDEELPPEIEEEGSACGVYRMSVQDWSAARAMIFADVYRNEAHGKAILSGADGSPLTPDQGRLVDANVLARDYARNVETNPTKSRMAFWHDMRRVYYPKHPGSSKKHRIPSLALPTFHAIFDELGARATYVIAFAMANWTDINTDNGVWKRPPAPTPEHIAYHLGMFDSAWLDAVPRTERAEEFLLRLGVDREA
jgi:hypothetical protein